MKISSDAQLITDKSNIKYLSNFNGSSGFMLLTKKKKYLFTDFRYMERAKSIIKKDIELVNITRVWRNPTELAKSWQSILAKHSIKILGMEESNLTVSQYKRFQKITNKGSAQKNRTKFVDISGEIEKIREIKTAEEIKIIQKSQDINGQVFLEIKKIIQQWLKSANKTPLREIDLAWKIKEIGHQLGAEEMSFDPIVGFGTHSARPHHEPDNTPLKKGDIILIDMGMKYKGYCSDMTRMLFTKTPTDKQAKIYNLVLEAQENAIKKIKAGVTGAEADAMSRDIIKKAGYGEQYGHAGGHGVGLDIHETPSLSENFKTPLKEDSIITIEPGIYLEGEFGVRIEDMILVTKTGNKSLTKVQKRLEDIILD
ncbi:MAG: Xaa-Pro peptidase family protein [Patescibacteria group bacterium]